MPLRINVEIDPIHCSGKRDTSEEENNQYQEREGGSEVHHLTHRLHPLGDTGKHHDPGEHVAPEQFPHDGSQLVNALRYYQDMIAGK